MSSCRPSPPPAVSPAAERSGAAPTRRQPRAARAAAAAAAAADARGVDLCSCSSSPGRGRWRRRSRRRASPLTLALDTATAFSSSTAEAEAESEAGGGRISTRVVTLLEFYSGMGTMRWSLEAALEAMAAEAQGRTTPTPTPTQKPTIVRGIGAVDNSEVANAVYAANYPGDDFPPLRCNIEHLTQTQLDAAQPPVAAPSKNRPCDAALGGAEVWTLSPPCQPYTRKGKELHGDDPRAASFLHLLGIFPDLADPPPRVLVENVVGFERSRPRRELVAALEAAGYAWREFQLSPHHLGVPYTRERYYLLAKRTRTRGAGGGEGGGEDGGGGGGGGAVVSLRFRDDAAPATATAGSDDYRRVTRRPRDEGELNGVEAEAAAVGGGGGVGGEGGDVAVGDEAVRGALRRTVGEYLEFTGGFGARRTYPPRDNTGVGGTTGRVKERAGGDEDVTASSNTQEGDDHAAAAGAVAAAAVADAEELASLAVPGKIVDKYWRWLDVCSPSSTRCQCFTAGYGKTVYGGSVLASEDFVSAYCGPADPVTGRHRLLGPPPGPPRASDQSASVQLCGSLRYFSPREVANLHGLGDDFVLPTETLTRRQLWFTLGNSISVDVVAALMKHLMED